MSQGGPIIMALAFLEKLIVQMVMRIMGANELKNLGCYIMLEFGDANNGSQ